MLRFASIVAARGNLTAALLLIFLPLIGFHSFKGIGLVSLDPIAGSLSEGKDRGAFLARMQINVHVLLIITNLFIAFFLGADAATGRYIILMAAGIAAEAIMREWKRSSAFGSPLAAILVRFQSTD